MQLTEGLNEIQCCDCQRNLIIFQLYQPLSFLTKDFATKFKEVQSTITRQYLSSRVLCGSSRQLFGEWQCLDEVSLEKIRDSFSLPVRT